MKKLLLILLCLPMFGFGQDILLLIQHNPKPPSDPITTGATWFVIAIIVFIFLAIKNFLQNKD